MNRSTFGDCPECECPMEAVYFVEDEYEVTSFGTRHKTGRWRRAVSHLTCPLCGKNECVDDSFDGPWIG